MGLQTGKLLRSRFKPKATKNFVQNRRKIILYLFTPSEIKYLPRHVYIILKRNLNTYQI